MDRSLLPMYQEDSVHGLTLSSEIISTSLSITLVVMWQRYHCSAGLFKE